MRFLSLGLLLFLVPVSAWGQHLACSPCSYDLAGKDRRLRFLLHRTHQQCKQNPDHPLKIAKGKRLLIRPLPGTDQISPGPASSCPLSHAKTARSTDGVITITSNAPDSPFTIDVSGIGVSDVAAQLAISPAKLSFGNVTVGSSASLRQLSRPRKLR